MMSWYIERGPESDVVISSRVRLARNLKDFPFPARMNTEQGKQVVEKIKNAVLNKENSSDQIAFYEIQSLSSVDKQVLVEKHLISPNLLESRQPGGVIISKDENISIMVNEEDHLRIQCMYPGMQPDSCWKLCNSIDSSLEKAVGFAYNNEYGYLTCCPTNIGTGMRASVMMHLPALSMTGYIGRILEACSKIGVAVRGLYGENTEASGNIFQISNQVTLGQNEDEIIAGVSNIIHQIIGQERSLRNELYKQNPYRLEDRIYRSLGVFANARIMSAEEGFKLLSDIRLGIDMGIIKDIRLETLNELMVLIQPANLQKLAGRSLNPDERDIRRAELIRDRLHK